MTDLNPSSSALQRAYELIQRDNLVAARDLLDDYLITHPNDADAWWLYAHAVADPVEAQSALQTVLRLRPDYPGAGELLDESQELLPITDENLNDDDLWAADTGTPGLETVETPLVPAERSASVSPLSSSSAGMQRPIFLLAAIIIAVLLIGLAVILANQANAPAVNNLTPTSVAVATTITQSTPTVAATSEVAPVTTEVMSITTDEAEASEYTALYAALANFDVVEDSATTEDAAVGQTLLLSICNNAEAGLRNTSIDALSAIASGSADLDAIGTEFVGVRVLDCERGLVLRTLAVSIADAAAYESGEITQPELTSRLVVIS
jgi:hypothetical protein